MNSETNRIPKQGRRSNVWSYFTVEDRNEKRARCNICGQNLSYGTTISNLRRHFDKRHLNVNTGCVNDSYTMPADNLTHFTITTLSSPTPSIRRKFSEIAPSSPDCLPSTSAQGYNGNESDTSDPRGSPLPPPVYVSTFVDPNHNEQTRQITMDLLKLFTKDFQPFSMVRDSGFKNFVKALNPDYTLPSQKKISRVLIPIAYEEAMKAVRQKLKHTENFCLTLESWISKGKTEYKYVTVTSYYIDNDFSLQSVFLGSCRLNVAQSKLELSTEIKKITDNFNVSNKVLVAVTDNASDMKEAVEELGWNHLACFAHFLNTIVEEALNDQKNLIQKIEDLVDHFKQSPKATEELLNFQKAVDVYPQKKLKKHEPERWISTYIMIQRVAELRTALETIRSSDTDFPQLSDVDWSLCEQLCRVLKPLEAVIRNLSGEKYMTVSQVILVTRGLINVCKRLSQENFHSKIKDVIQSLSTGLEKRFESIEINNIVALSTFLDPRFKLNVFSDSKAADKIRTEITELVKNLMAKDFPSKPQPTPVTDRKQEGEEYDVFKEFDTMIASTAKKTASSEAFAEVQRYLDDEYLPRLADPLLWWRDNHNTYPTLAKLVVSKFNAVATCVPCERIYSKAGATLKERRAHLSPLQIEKLLFLNGNS